MVPRLVEALFVDKVSRGIHPCQGGNIYIYIYIYIYPRVQFSMQLRAGDSRAIKERVHCTEPGTVCTEL